jgi:hypothetical protein
MRAWLSQDSPQPGQMAAMVDEVLEAAERDAPAEGDGVVRWKTAGDKAETREWCRELVIRLEPILLELAVPIEYQPAVRFSAPLVLPHPEGGQRQIQLIGEIDLLTRDAVGGWRVWDLKGTRDPSYWRKVVGQLLFYEVAVRLMHGDWPVQSGLIQPMIDQRVLTFEFSETDRRDMMYRMSKVATDIWRGALGPKADMAGCDRCDVRHACPKFAGTGRGRVAWPA